MTIRSDVEALAQVDLFSACDAAHLQVLVFSAEKLGFARGDTIVEQNRADGRGYLVLRGSVDVRMADATGSSSIATLEAGAFVGELGMIGGMPSAITAIATSPTQTLSISRQLFLRVAAEFPEFGSRIHNRLAHKLETTTRELQGVKNLFDRAESLSRRQN